MEKNQENLKKSQELLDNKDYDSIIGLYKEHSDLGPLLKASQNKTSAKSFRLVDSGDGTSVDEDSSLCQSNYSSEIDLLIESFIGLGDLGFTMADIYEATLSSEKINLEDVMNNLTVSDYSESSEEEIQSAIDLLLNYSVTCQSEEYLDREIVLRLGYLLYLGKYIYGEKKTEYETLFEELKTEFEEILLNEEQESLYSSELEKLQSTDVDLGTIESSLEELKDIAQENEDEEFLEFIQKLEEKLNDVITDLKNNLDEVSIIFQQALTIFFLTGSSDNKLLKKLKDKFDEIVENKEVVVTIDGESHTFDWTTGYSETTDQILYTYLEGKITDDLSKEFMEDILQGLEDNIESRIDLISYGDIYEPFTTALESAIK